MPASAEQQPSGGPVAASISDAVVKIIQQYTGRGATRARTDINANSIVVLLSDTLTKGERVLVENGSERLVLRTREEFQRLMRPELVQAVERLSNRDVVAFMSENHVDPDMAAEIFVLAPEGAA